jgi:thiol-disulfide isomerase/thioredoxin/tetratricopeptide (TPR) repeat protein
MPTSSDELRASGNAAYKSGDYAKALSLYESAADASPSDPIPHTNRAAALLALRRVSDAVAASCTAVELGAGAGAAAGGAAAGKAVARLAISLLAAGEARQALALTDAYLEREEGGPSSSSLPAAPEAVAAVEDARKGARAAVGLLDAVPAPFFSATLPGDLPPSSAEQALSGLSQLLVAAPNAEPYLFAFAQALVVARRYEAATRVLRAVERARSDGLQGTVRDDLEGMGAVVDDDASGEGKEDDSSPSTPSRLLTSTFRFRLRPTPRLPSLPALLARAFLGACDLATAQVVLENALRADPDGTTPDGAGVAQLLKAVRAVNATREKGNAKHGEAIYADAAALYREAAAAAVARTGVDISTLHANLAASLLAMGSPTSAAEAADACRAAVAAWPGNARAWSRLGKSLLALRPSDQDGAHAALTAALHLQPDDGDAGKELRRIRARGGGGDDDEGGAGAMLGDMAGDALAHPGTDASYSALFSASAGAGKAAWGKGPSPALVPLFVGSSSSSSSASSGGAGKGRAPPPRSAPRLQVTDFFATWCGPCKQIAPVFSQLAQTTAAASFVKVDGDKCKGAVGGGGGGGGGGGAGGGCCGGGGGGGTAKGADACCGGSGGGGGGGCGKGGACSCKGGGASAASPSGAGVRAFPTFVAYLDGREIGRMEGADPRALGDFVKTGLSTWRRTPPPAPAQWAASFALVEAAGAVDVRPDVVQVLAQGMRACRVAQE